MNEIYKMPADQLEIYCTALETCREVLCAELWEGKKGLGRSELLRTATISTVSYLCEGDFIKKRGSNGKVYNLFILEAKMEKIETLFIGNIIYTIVD